MCVPSGPSFLALPTWSWGNDEGFSKADIFKLDDKGHLSFSPGTLGAVERMGESGATVEQQFCLTPLRLCFNVDRAKATYLFLYSGHQGSDWSALYLEQGKGLLS